MAPSFVSRFGKTAVLAGLFFLIILFSLLRPVAADPAAGCVNSLGSAATEAELNAAIGLYNAQTDACTYDITLTADILLTASTPTINNTVTGATLLIEGGGKKVDGQKKAGVRPFAVAANTTVTMQNITITGGSRTNVLDGGGAVLNYGTLTISSSTISDNAAHNGGGILNGGTLTISDSTISANSAAVSGGGIYNNAVALTISNSTFSANRVNPASGAGGAIHTLTPLTLNSVTFSGNSSASGAALFVYDSMAKATVSNSIFNGAGACWMQSGGNIIDRGGNLSSDSSCGFSAATSQNNVADMKLGPLADNGGPTFTHALLPGSPALNAGDNALAAGLTYDQRGAGFPRIAGAAVDIGAYEAACAAFPRSVATEAELRDAIACYNQLATAGTYQITLTADIPLTASTPAINNATTGVALLVEGGGKKVDGGKIAGVRPFAVAANTAVTMQNILITGGAPGDAGGGGVLNEGTLTIRGSTLSGNASNYGGGGIANERFSTLTISGSTLSGNAAGHAGGILNDGTLTISGSTLSGNTATGEGGGIESYGPLAISNSTISGNSSSDGSGGGIWNKGPLTISSSTFAGNAAEWDGDALYTKVGAVTLNNTLFAGSGGSATGDCAAASGAVSGSHNLFQSTAACGLANGVDGNITGADPRLGPLQDNGGPTKTHALLSGSPAIDKGLNSLAVGVDGSTPLTTDQRGAGYDRIVGTAVDIGAYEEQTVTLPPDICDPASGNLLANPCFEEGTAPWRFFTDGAGSFNTPGLNAYQGNFAGQVDIRRQGGNVQLFQRGLALKPDTRYELSFAAFSSNGRDLALFLHDDAAPYTNYGLNNLRFDLSSGWAVYQTSFTTSGFSSPVANARLRFWLAPFDADGMSYHIDWVALRESGGDPLPPTPPDPPVIVPPPGQCTAAPGNLLANPGFEAGTAGWSFFTDGQGTFDATAADPFECAANARVSIRRQGGNVQLFQRDIALQGGTTYRLRLAARSSGGQDVSLFMQQHGSPFRNYGLNGVQLDLTPAWQVFVVQFTAAGDAPLTDARLRLWLAPFDQNGAVYEFDDVVLQPLSAATTTAVPDAAPDAATAGGPTESAAGKKPKPPAAQGRPANVVLQQGYFLDGDEAARLRGAFVGANAEAFCYAARPSLSTLSPADGRLARVRILGLGNPRRVTITGITQSEPTGPAPDGTGVGGAYAQLRRERDDDGLGRVYHIAFTAVYKGKSCAHEVVVTVPLDRKTAVVDTGMRFDSTR